MVDTVTFKDGATLGSFVLGLFLIVLNVGTWWPTRKQLTKDPLGCALGIAPFLSGYCYGVLLLLCGGLLGWFGDAILWGGGWLGDGALIWGVGGHRASVQNASVLALTNGGLAMVLVFTAIVVVVMRRREAVRSAMRQGILAGILTGLVRGYLGLLAVPLASAANMSGIWLPGSS